MNNVKTKPQVSRPAWRWVPVEPTPEMCNVPTWDYNRFYSPEEIWKAMLAAAPTAPAEPAPQGEASIVDPTRSAKDMRRLAALWRYDKKVLPGESASTRAFESWLFQLDTLIDSGTHGLPLEECLPLATPTPQPAGERHPSRAPQEWAEIVALEDQAGGVFAAGSLTRPVHAEKAEAECTQAKRLLFKSDERNDILAASLAQAGQVGPVMWQARVTREASAWREITPTKADPTVNARVRYLQTVKRGDGAPAYEFRPLFAHPPAARPLTGAARDVLTERARQVSVEGWTALHDAQHSTGELAEAAAGACLCCNWQVCGLAA